MIDRCDLLDRIEDIQDKSNTYNIGSNESELDTRECVADLFEVELKNNRKELLIGALIGWKDYEEQGISIEDYVEEIISNL